MNIDERTRAYVYRVLLAVVPLLVGYGLLAEGQAALWIGLAGALLAVGGDALAVKHTSTERPPLLHEHGDVLHGHPNDGPDHTHEA
jgi:hypothetical protein